MIPPLTRSLAVVFASAALALPRPAAADEPDACAVLAVLDFRESAGAAVRLEGALAPAEADLPTRCRVIGQIEAVGRVEIWLPADDWNGRALIAGCEADCTSLRTGVMEDAAARGYATAASQLDGSQNPPTAAGKTPSVDEWRDRLLVATTRLTRALIQAFYGDHPARVYFRGCGPGGRQGLIAATRHPDIFDGMLAGAPFEYAGTTSPVTDAGLQLERFVAREGRLILWQGERDAASTAALLDWWREALGTAGDAHALAQSARLYLLPDVEPCGDHGYQGDESKGAGAVDWLAALNRWVEADEAPDTLIAWRMKDRVPAPFRFPPAGPILLKRPIFPWPDVALYNGRGDPLDPANYLRVRRGTPPRSER